MIFPLLAFFLGIKHSYDTDHIIAVSNILLKSPSLKETSKMSISWAMGHTITASIITLLLYAFKEVLILQYLYHFEFGVAIMLLGLGFLTFKDLFLHKHVHEHDGKTHEHYHFHFFGKKTHHHKQMFGIGVIHGLASNDELLILLTASLAVTTFIDILIGIAIFSFGVTIGMIGYGIAFSFPLIKIEKIKFRKIFALATSNLSIIYGILILLNIV